MLRLLKSQHLNTRELKLLQSWVNHIYAHDCRLKAKPKPFFPPPGFKSNEEQVSFQWVSRVRTSVEFGANSWLLDRSESNTVQRKNSYCTVRMHRESLSWFISTSLMLYCLTCFFLLNSFKENKMERKISDK